MIDMKPMALPAPSVAKGGSADRVFEEWTSVRRQILDDGPQRKRRRDPPHAAHEDHLARPCTGHDGASGAGKVCVKDYNGLEQALSDHFASTTTRSKTLWATPPT